MIGTSSAHVEIARDGRDTRDASNTKRNFNESCGVGTVTCGNVATRDRRDNRRVNFSLVDAAALPVLEHLCARWLPGGRRIYRDAAGAALAVVARFDSAAGGKEVRLWSYGRRIWKDRSGRHRDEIGWHAKAPPDPRPLYGLDRLAAQPTPPRCCSRITSG